MSEEWDDIPREEELPEEEGAEELVETEGKDEGRFARLLGSDSRKYKLSGMFKDWFLDYSSYVILQRAVPHIVDGLKPVQRRVLHAMYRMDDGRYTKVANIVGQAMQYHPHGDASILGALVQLGQKGYVVEKHPDRRLKCSPEVHRSPSFKVRQGGRVRPEGDDMDDFLRRKKPGTDRAPGPLPHSPRPGN